MYVSEENLDFAWHASYVIHLYHMFASRLLSLQNYVEW
jgi:hypothetical protein